MRADARSVGREIIAHHSKSFAFASRLLPPEVRDRAVVIYAWCRRADDAIDLADEAEAPSALARLWEELETIYGGSPPDDPILDAFRAVVEDRGIPREYPAELLEGMAMDLAGVRYDDIDTLLLYCYRVAGVVGLMMCHAMGMEDESATINAVHLGVAMQMTNIARDVAEDWERGRLYLPEEMLAPHGGSGLASRLAEPLPGQARPALAAATRGLLDLADDYYRSGDEGIPTLSWRCGLAVRTARRVYSAIGERVRRRGCDPSAGRAYVSGRGKLALAAQAVAASLGRRRTPPPARGAGEERWPPPTRIVTAEETLPLNVLQPNV